MVVHWVWYKGKQTEQWNRIKASRNCPTHMEIDIWEKCKGNSKRNVNLQQCLIVWTTIWREENLYLYLQHKRLTQNSIDTNF